MNLWFVDSDVRRLCILNSFAYFDFMASIAAVCLGNSNSPLRSPCEYAGRPVHECENRGVRTPADHSQQRHVDAGRTTGAECALCNFSATLRTRWVLGFSARGHAPKLAVLRGAAAALRRVECSGRTRSVQTSRRRRRGSQCRPACRRERCGRAADANDAK
jgi:hypothetical protein